MAIFFNCIRFVSFVKRIFKYTYLIKNQDLVHSGAGIGERGVAGKCARLHSIVLHSDVALEIVLASERQRAERALEELREVTIAVVPAVSDRLAAYSTHEVHRGHLLEQSVVLEWDAAQPHHCNTIHTSYSTVGAAGGLQFTFIIFSYNINVFFIT